MDLKLKGVRVHNLKNISVTIPRDKLTVLTGLSGSGKSSLAFDTIYAEGHRRFVESLSSYARQFLGQMDKPDLDTIEGLSPTIAIDQKTTSKNPRSTVGTVTEIFDYLRLLYARIGVPHCPVCGEEISSQTVDEITDSIKELPEGTRFIILAPVIDAKKGMHEKVLADALKAGYIRARIDGEMRELDDGIELDKNKKHAIEIVVDRLVMGADIDSRLAESVETAASLSGGIIKIFLPDENEDENELTFSQNYACSVHGVSLGELEPRMFSFNSPFGACPECGGLGESYVLSPDKLVPDKEHSLFTSAIVCNGFKTVEAGSWFGELANKLGKYYGFDIHTPISKFTPEGFSVLFYGNLGKKRQLGEPKFEGVVKMIDRRYQQNISMPEAREYFEEFMDTVTCPHCKGKRLKPESLAVTVGGLNIIEFSELSIAEAKDFISSLKLSKTHADISREILKEINNRLGFLLSVGLEYLTLARRSGSLSGGEAQRIRLATQIGSALVGVLYILDEPSIGLHQRDNLKLISTLKRLRDIGNTVIVVEHDEETIRSADYVVDIGPKAGVHGGEVLFEGSPEELAKCKKSITGQYLCGERKIDIPNVRRLGNGKFITVVGAKENNLKNITVDFPLGRFICVTGVSGSGKSSLVDAVLYKALAKKLGKYTLTPGKFEKITGDEEIDKIIAIDQSPIGRSPRSNPATYTGLFGDIRAVFANTPDAKARGYKEGRFSFNIKGGRCEACEGNGVITIEMHFLPDVYVTCDVCKGKRYNRETLEIKYKDKSIFDVLDMTVDEGLEFFTNYPSIRRKLQTLKDVGLGYIKIGQPSTQLSGGEAQRVKLATELARRSTGSTLYVLDEPTTGLHSYDVDKLRSVLMRLVDLGNTVLVIEHNLDLIKSADFIIDMGPEGGNAGGTVIAAGTPEHIAACKQSFTGEFLRQVGIIPEGETK